MKYTKEWLFEHTMPVGECIIWTRSLDSSGYGNTFFRGRYTSTHRISYQLFIGPIPDGMCVLHRCDTRACINPGHLWIGTKKDNTQDAIKKGRFSFNVDRMKGYGRSRGVVLTWEQVKEIRKKYKTGKYTHRSLAPLYGVGKSCIGSIVSFENWKQPSPFTRSV